MAYTRQAASLLTRREFAATATSALIAGPLAARGQTPGRTYRIAVYATASSVAQIGPNGFAFYRALYDELRTLGFVEGVNVTIERHSAAGQDQAAAIALAREVVASNPDIIFVGTFRGAQILKAATT